VFDVSTLDPLANALDEELVIEVLAPNGREGLLHLRERSIEVQHTDLLLIITATMTTMTMY